MEKFKTPPDSPPLTVINPDDQPMWSNTRAVVPTPSSAIFQRPLSNNFRIKEEAVMLRTFPFLLSGEAKTWINELDEGTITSRNELREAFISRYFSPAKFKRLLNEIHSFDQLSHETLVDAWLHDPTQGILDAGGIFLSDNPNEALKMLEDKINVKTFAYIALSNHVGDNELKSIDGVGNGVLTKNEIKKDEMGLGNWIKRSTTNACNEKICSVGITILRYISTRPNGDSLRKCILQGPYIPSTVIFPTVPTIDDSPKVSERTAVETLLNMSPENKEHYQSEKEEIHFLLTGIGDEIYSTVDACKIAHDMWIAIERLQQHESLNIQDVKLIYFGSLFLQQLQPEWSRFVTIVKQNHDLDTVSYHKLFDVLKQYQKEVNEIRAQRIAKNANPLALIAAAQQYPNPYYQAPKSHKSYAPPSKQSSSTRSNASTKYKVKEIAKPITPPSESASEEDSDPKQAQRDKDMQKNLTLIAKTVTVAEARETVGNQVVQQTGIQCFNCKEFGHFAKEFRKPKRVKDYTYHKENMLLCKQVKKGVPLQAEQADWLEDTDEEIDKQELEAHYNYMEKIQEVPIADSGTNTEPLEKVHYNAEYNVFANTRHHFEQLESINNTCVVKKVDSNVIPDSPDMCINDIQTDQNAKECNDECDALANLISNLTLDTEENKKILKQLKKANASLTQELKECKSNLEVSNTTHDSCLIALQSKQTELETYKTLNDRIVDYDKPEPVKEKHDKLVKHSFLTKSRYEGLVKEKTKIPYDPSNLANRFTPDTEETLTLKKESRSKLNKDLVKPYDYTKQNSLYENSKPALQEHHDQLAHANEVRKKMWR
ncbi:retrovirus-related pol polyprotein from transposon TNT 1-94 [Tanacetum coccineum]